VSDVAIEVPESQLLSKINAFAALLADPDWVGVCADITESMFQINAMTSRKANGRVVVGSVGTNFRVLPIFPSHEIMEVIATAEVPH
jgi:hypothetical protein